MAINDDSPDLPPPLEDTPPPLDNAPPSGTQSAQKKADLGKRFIALLIDCVLASVIAAVLSFVSRPLGVVAAGGLLLVRDGLDIDFMKQRSIGKKVVKLRVVRNNGAPMDLQTSIQRNWPLAIGSLTHGIISLGGTTIYGMLGWIATLVSLIGLVEAVLVITDARGLRLGDKLANTKVQDE